MVDFQQELEIQISESGVNTTYTFRGSVTEEFKYGSVEVRDAKSVVFDLEGILNFNSCGIREWIQFVKGFDNAPELIFQKCSIVMVDQINMIADTLRQGRVQSFYAPYYSDCCGEVTRLIDVETYQAELAGGQAPDLECNKCGEPLEFDALEESYFIFFNRSHMRSAS